MGRLGLSVRDLDGLTWRQLDDMDHARRALMWELVADVKSFLAGCHGVTLSPEEVNPYKRALADAKRERRLVKPSEVGVDGNVVSSNSSRKSVR